jgi:hypothetical protein
MAGVPGVVELMQRTAIEASPDLLRALQTHMLGHKDPSVTLRVYADLFDTDLDAVAKSLHAKYSPKRTTSLDQK